MDPTTGAIVNTAAQISADAVRTKRANKRMVEFWNMQNEYNSPRSQMQRLQEAGLNPNLIYGSSANTGNAGDIGRPETMSAPPNPIQEYQDLRMSNAQLDLNVLQQTTEMQRAALTKGQAYKTEHDTNLSIARENQTREQTRLLQNSFDDQLQLRSLAVKNLQQEVLGKALDNDFKDRTLRDRVEKIYWETRSAEATKSGRELNNELLKLQTQFLGIGLDRNSPWYAKIFGNLLMKTGINHNTFGHNPDGSPNPKNEPKY